MENNSILPEIIVATGDQKNSKYISSLSRQGRIKKLVSTIYTSNLAEDESVVVRRNLFFILGSLFSGAVVSHRSAFEMRPTQSGDFYLTYKYTKKFQLKDLVIHLVEGPSGQPEDTPFVNGLFISCPERAYLEKLQVGYQKGNTSKCLPVAEIEERLDKVIRINGENAINATRDKARMLSERLGWTNAFSKLDKIIGAILSTHDVATLQSPIAKARALGEPYDAGRIELFETLFSALSNQIFKSCPEDDFSLSSYRNFAFFESYFSNYIEGTEFTLEDARHIIEYNIPLPSRDEDSHDIMGTYQIVSDFHAMSIVPSSPDELIYLLQSRHAILLSARPEKSPGMFKMKNNRAGNSLFVDCELVKGTLKKGFDYYRALSSPFAKAVFMLFMVSEVHPFDDGNGRISRIMMNAELTHAGEKKILVPTVFRTDYLGALRRLTRQNDPDVLIKAMLRVRDFSAQLQKSDFEVMKHQLEEAKAFSDMEEDILLFKNNVHD